MGHRRRRRTLSYPADHSLYRIAIEKKVLLREELDRFLAAAARKKTTLEALLFRRLDPVTFSSLLRQRERFAVACGDCGGSTYALPEDAGRARCTTCAGLGAPGAPVDDPAPGFGPPPGGGVATLAPRGRTTARRAQAPTRSLFFQVPSVLFFPLRSRESLAMTAVGAAFVLALQVGLAFVPLIFFPAVLILALYPVAYNVKVTQHAMNGELDVPGWPELDFYELFCLFLRLIGLGLAVAWPLVLLPFLPTELGWGGVLAVAILVGAYYPMAYLLMVAFTSGRAAWHYPAGLRAVLLTLPDYLVLLGICAFVVGVQTGLELATGAFLNPVFAMVLQSVVAFYAAIVLAHAVGRYYFANREALGWFRSR